jgi:hypothetical protein
MYLILAIGYNKRNAFIQTNSQRSINPNQISFLSNSLHAECAVASII